MPVAVSPDKGIGDIGRRAIPEEPEPIGLFCAAVELAVREVIDDLHGPRAPEMVIAVQVHDAVNDAYAPAALNVAYEVSFGGAMFLQHVVTSSLDVVTS